MIYQPKQIKRTQENSLFADILVAVNVIFVYLNYRENKENVELTKQNNAVSREIAGHLKQINDDGIVGRLCKEIEKGANNGCIK